MFNQDFVGEDRTGHNKMKPSKKKDRKNNNEAYEKRYHCLKRQCEKLEQVN